MGLGSFVTFIPTTNADAARAFYADALGLTFVRDDQFALVFEHKGVTLRIARVESLQPQPFTVLGFHVGDVTAHARELAQRGVVFERFPGIEQDELGLWSPAPDVHVGWFKDPDGNLLSISS